MLIDVCIGKAGTIGHSEMDLLTLHCYLLHLSLITDHSKTFLPYTFRKVLMKTRNMCGYLEGSRISCTWHYPTTLEFHPSAKGSLKMLMCIKQFLRRILLLSPLAVYGEIRVNFIDSHTELRRTICLAFYRVLFVWCLHFTRTNTIWLPGQEERRSRKTTD